MLIIDSMQQGSWDWQVLRSGVLTASRATRLLSPVTEVEYYGHLGCDIRHKSQEVADKCRRGHGPAEFRKERQISLVSEKSQRTLLYELLAEYFQGPDEGGFGGSKWTERGKDLEPAALAYFSFMTDLEPRPCAFIFKGEDRLCGCSPDSLIYSGAEPDEGLEIKNPKLATHLKYATEGMVEYMPQVQFSLWVTGLAAWWFLSYVPEQPAYLERIEPDPWWMNQFDTYVPPFLKLMADTRQSLIEAGYKRQVQ